MNYFVKRWKRIKSYNSTYNELWKMSDRELDDIGITRGDIHNISLESSRF